MHVHSHSWPWTTFPLPSSVTKLNSQLGCGLIGSVTDRYWERDSLWYVTLRLCCLCKCTYFIQVILTLYPFKKKKWKRGRSLKIHIQNTNQSKLTSKPWAEKSALMTCGNKCWDKKSRMLLSFFHRACLCALDYTDFRKYHFIFISSLTGLNHFYASCINPTNSLQPR